MRHTIAIEHPAVTRLLVANPRETVEALPVPENGCYGIEFGRVTVGDTLHDVLSATVRQGAHPERGGGHTELLLIQPTSGELSIARINHAETIQGRDHPENASVRKVETATDLMRLEGAGEDDAIRLIRRDVVPQGDATTIEGALDLLGALSQRGGVSRDVEAVIRKAREKVALALDAQDHDERMQHVARTGEPQGDVRSVGLRAIDDLVHTAMMAPPAMMDEMRMHRGHEEPWTSRADHAAKAFGDMLGDAGLISVDGGPPRPIDEVVLSYGGERSSHRQVMADGMLVQGIPTFAHDVCLLRGDERAVTLRIVA